MRTLLSTLLLLLAACSTSSTSSTTAKGSPTPLMEPAAWPTCCGTALPDFDQGNDCPPGCCTCCDPGTCCDDEDMEPQCGQHGCLCHQQDQPQPPRTDR
jgi:hypothetical protein